MLRDNRKDENYFEVYLREIQQNISEYYELYKNIPSENQFGKNQCLRYIAQLYRNELVAMYSAGLPIPQIRQVFQQCAETTVASVDEGYIDYDDSSFCMR